MNIILFFFIALSAFAQDCPPESLPIDYTSPVTKNKIVTCGYMKNGSLVKHGPEKEFTPKGKLIRTEYFQNGLPAGDPDIDASIDMIKKVLKVLSFSKGPNDGMFKVFQCDQDRKTWVSAALISQGVQKTYIFSDHCDLSGTFVGSFLQEFSVALYLRHLHEFDRVKMNVKLILNQKKNFVRYLFNVTEGELTSSKKRLPFSAVYAIEIDPLSNEPKKETQKGTITLLKSDKNPVKVTRPFVFDL